MIAPGALVMLSPVVTGTLFGTKTLAGVLAGSLVSGVQVSVGYFTAGIFSTGHKKAVGFMGWSKERR